MREDIKQAFETMIKSEDYAGGEKRLNEIMTANPGDWEAKMLFGTCRMLQGDAETAKRIYSEVKAHFSSAEGISTAEKTFWQKYHRWFIYGILGSALVVVGTGLFGHEVVKIFTSLMPHPAAAKESAVAEPCTVHCKRFTVLSAKQNVELFMTMKK